MTRETAKKMFKDDVDSYGKPKKIMSKLDMIFDDFEKEKQDIIDMYKGKPWSTKDFILLFALSAAFIGAVAYFF